MINQCNIYQYLTEYSNLQPYKTALKIQEETVNYSELYRMVSSFADGIFRTGVKAGDMIAVIMDNSINMVVVMLAILCNRCVVLPIESELPSERIKMIIEDAKPKIAFCDSNLTQDKLKKLDYQSVIINAIPKDYITTTDLVQIFGSIQSDDGAFCMFTSGTTGAPKGVILTYKGILNHIQAKVDLLNLNHEKKMCLSFSTSFVASIWQILTPIMLGAQLVLYHKDLVKKPYRFFKQLQKDTIDFVCITPHTLRGYLEYIKHGRAKLPLENLKSIILTGEKADASLVKDFYNEYGNIEIINAYGQTECSDDTFHYRIPRSIDTCNVPIGKPIPNMFGYVLDENFNPVASGSEGELFISGTGVAEGYFNNEELSALKFIKLPHIEGYLYRTGDIVIEDDNQLVTYIGRKDNQIKIRGYRIQLEEVENTINQFPNISQAIAKESELNGTKIIEAVYTGSVNISVDDLKGYLRSYLPDYMIPARFTQIQSFEYTQNGKINRKKNYSSADNIDKAQTASSLNVVQKEIYDNIRSVLNSEISLDTSLSAEGIDSISFVSIVVSLEESFDFEFDDDKTLTEAFPTILDLIKYVEAKNNVSLSK